MSKKLMVTMLALSLALGIFLIPKSGACGDSDIWIWFLTQKTKGFVGLSTGSGNPDTDMELENGGLSLDNMMARERPSDEIGGPMQRIGEGPDNIMFPAEDPYDGIGGTMSVLDP